MGYSFKFNFSEKDIDFSPRQNGFFNFDKFLINEFFNSNNIEITEIMKQYRLNYGISAYNYVMSNYFKKWRNGSRELSNVQYERIVSIMKVCLNESAKSKLEKIKNESKFQYGINETLNTITKTVSRFFSAQSELYKTNKIQLILESTNDFLSLYKYEIERINTLVINNESVFDKLYVLDKDEINEVLNISKSIIYIKLKNQFENILKDLNTFSSSKILELKGSNNIIYKLNSFNKEINLNKFIHTNTHINFQIKNETTGNSKYKVFSDKYFAEELASIESQKIKDSITMGLNDFDLSIFYETTIKLISSKNEIFSKTKFIGSGGSLFINIDIKDIKSLKMQLIYQYLLTVTIILCIIILLYLFHKFIESGVALIITITFGWYLIPLFSNFREKITYIKNQIKKYS